MATQIRPTPMLPKPEKRKTVRKPLRTFSKKWAKEVIGYMGFKKFLLSERPYCEFTACFRQPCDLHHIAGRRGGLLMDPSNILVLCREHHQWIHEHSREARQRGLLR